MTVAMEVEGDELMFDNHPKDTPVRILVTGSRDWTEAETVNDTLDLLTAFFPDGHTFVVVHGDCPDGADALADAWATTHDVPTEKHPANWSQGRASALMRNSTMVDLGAFVCIGFINHCAKKSCKRTTPHGSHGTMDTVTKARHAGIPVWKIRGNW